MDTIFFLFRIILPEIDNVSALITSKLNFGQAARIILQVIQFKFENIHSLIFFPLNVIKQSFKYQIVFQKG